MKSHDLASLYKPINNVVYEITSHPCISLNRWAALVIFPFLIKPQL